MKAKFEKQKVFKTLLAVLPQDYRIFRIHILLNFEILKKFRVIVFWYRANNDNSEHKFDGKN